MSGVLHSEKRPRITQAIKNQEVDLNVRKIRDRFGGSPNMITEILKEMHETGLITKKGKSYVYRKSG